MSDVAVWMSPDLTDPGMPLGMKEGKMHVKFYQRAVKNEFQTKQEGRPIYDNQDYICIDIPGGLSTVDRPVQEKDQYEYATNWARYKAGQEQTVSGTPIEQWPLLNVSEVATLKDLKIFSVEQLADASDIVISKFGMGGFEKRKAAQAYLEQAKDGSGITKLVSENEVLKSDLADLKDTIKELQAQLKDMKKDKK